MRYQKMRRLIKKYELINYLDDDYRLVFNVKNSNNLEDTVLN